MLLCSWLIQLYHVVQSSLAYLKISTWKVPLNPADSMWCMRQNTVKLSEQIREDLWLQLPPAGVHDWWIWAVVGYLYGSETWKSQGFSIQSQIFHWVHQEGEQRAEVPPVLSINGMAKLAFWVPGLLEGVCVDWGKYKSKCKTWKLSQWKLPRKFGEKK